MPKRRANGEGNIRKRKDGRWEGRYTVDAHVFLYGLLQFLLDFRLRLAKNILDDGLAGFRIVTDCVASFPSSILSLADVPLAVCSSFRHKISLLCQRTIP